MADNVHKLELVEVSEAFRFDVDEILEAAKGHGLRNVVIIGELPDGDPWISSAAGAAVALFLMERAKLQILQDA